MKRENKNDLGRFVVLFIILILLLAVGYLYTEFRRSAGLKPQQTTVKSQSVEIIQSPNIFRGYEGVDKIYSLNSQEPFIGVIPPEKPILKKILNFETYPKVKIYNDYAIGFNKIDGKMYLDDVYKYLKIYAPKGLWISAALAQSYTEGGAGKDVVGVDSTGNPVYSIYCRTNNCFGIMAGPSWSGYVYSRSTGIVYRSFQEARIQGVSGLFRVYDNMEQSVIDYVNLIKGDSYCGVLSTPSPESYLQYLLSRNYGERWMYNTWCSIMKMYNLKQYD